MVRMIARLMRESYPTRISNNNEVTITRRDMPKVGRPILFSKKTLSHDMICIITPLLYNSSFDRRSSRSPVPNSLLSFLFQFPDSRFPNCHFPVEWMHPHDPLGTTFSTTPPRSVSRYYMCRAWPGRETKNNRSHPVCDRPTPAECTRITSYFVL